MSAIRVRIATITVAALTLVLAAAFPVQAAAAPVQAASLPNCNTKGAVTPCFEPVWADGVQVKMKFVNLNPKPSNAPTVNSSWRHRPPPPRALCPSCTTTS